ncbi:hypothetical protein Zmor_001742 [Zophobas morio]|uniref:Uncharacterized protein n=1 Tax=Zophobas morio TaxID=2755281 RepID=A0AA38J4Q5_9CUCU|nr:hypothetical protein Zmor_001742 [Zophobas morio]
MSNDVRLASINRVSASRQHTSNKQSISKGSREHTTKFEPKWDGPYGILAAKGLCSYESVLTRLINLSESTMFRFSAEPFANSTSSWQVRPPLKKKISGPRESEPSPRRPPIPKRENCNSPYFVCDMSTGPSTITIPQTHSTANDPPWAVLHWYAPYQPLYKGTYHPKKARTELQ